MSTVKIKAEQKKISGRQFSKKNKSAEEEKEEFKEKTLKANIDRTNSLLKSVSANLDLLGIDNFDEMFPDLLKNMKEAANLREKVIKEVGFEELSKNWPELFLTAKQIEKKYDNIVEWYSQEGKRLEKELSGVISQKKIANYLRC